MNDDYIVFGAPDIRQDEVDEVADSLRSGWLGTGPKVQRFERDFAAYQNVAAECVAAVSSCTAALHVSLEAAGVGAGDEVITTAMTFCATANAVIHAGATPVPVDIEPDTLNIDPVAIENAINERTRAIIPVHFAGRPCDMNRLVDIADRHGLAIVEDCAHAIESEWHGQRVGTFGDFGCYSFYATKNVTTGEGGMVLGASRDAVERIRTLSLHGMTKDAWHRFSDKGYKHYRVVEAGYKYNMMDLQAAIGIHQLERIEAARSRREQLWHLYQDAFAGLPIGTPPQPAADTRHAYHLYTVTIDDEDCGISRDAFLESMHAAGIGVGVHYLCLAEHPYYQDRFGWRAEDYPCATAFGRRTASLPLSPKVTDTEADRIIETVTRLVGGQLRRRSRSRG